MKTLYTIIALVVLVITGVYIFLETKDDASVKKMEVVSFEDCVSAGYLVMESYPRQCRTPDGRIYTEEIQSQKIAYTNATDDDIQVELPFAGAVTGKQFSVIGKARGTWYFEASFPVLVLDKNGAVLFQAPAQAQGEWMTVEFVPFKIDITIPNNYIGPATLVLKKDNPSGDPSRDASMSIPITIEY